MTTMHDVREVEKLLKRLGFQLNEVGYAYAFMSLTSGYGYAETASQIALVTMARDVRQAMPDIVKVLKLLAHSRAIIDILKEMKDLGMFSEKAFLNDAAFFFKISIIDENQCTWISKLLEDPVLSNERLSVSTINIEYRL